MFGKSELLVQTSEIFFLIVLGTCKYLTNFETWNTEQCAHIV